MPDHRALDYERQLTAPEPANVLRGHLPRDMDNKWFCVVENDRLYLHPSWTGHAMFEAEPRTQPDAGTDVTNLSRNADRDQLNMDDNAATDLFDRLLTRLASQTL